jgi:tetratricopeptide (TPR) repeat protein
VARTRRRGPAPLLSLLLLPPLFAGCRSPTARAAPPEVEYAGCREVLAPAMRCLLRSKRGLRLWVRAEGERRYEVRVDGRRVAATTATVGEGQRFTLTVPLGAKKVDLSSSDAGGRALWSLELAEPAADATTSASDVPPGAQRRAGEHDVVAEIEAAADFLYPRIVERDLVAARTTLAQMRLPAKAPAESRYLVAYYRGLVAEQEGDYRTALAGIDAAVEIARRVAPERLLWIAEHERALLLRGIGRSREASETFARLRQTSFAKDPCEEGQLLNNQAWSALLAREAGEDVPDPTSLLQESLARRQSCAVANPEYRVDATMNLALAHLQQGRLAQAERLLAAAHQLEPQPTLPHLLWSLDLEGRIALADRRPGVARERFDELGKLAAETGSPHGRLRAAIGQARSLRALGDATAAVAMLQRAETALDEQSLLVPVHEGRETFLAARRSLVSLHVELLLDAERTAEALAVARHARSRVLRQLAHGDSLANLPAPARARRAELLTSYARRRSALEERAAADWKLPADRRAYERAARQAEAESVQNLLDAAFAELGRAALRPGGVLPPPGEGELLLVYHPLDGRHWVGFAADRRATTVQRFELPPGPLPPADELARRLLAPFGDRIAAAKRLRVVTSGELAGIDFQTLPLRGEPLLAHAPVVYGLDLPAEPRGGSVGGHRALLVADPRGDLPGARDEGRMVEQALATAPQRWRVEALTAESAGVAAVRQGLVDADLLHYAGHGSYSGLGGWDSSLLLADATRLTLGDLLALPRVPSWVVLAGCDTGRSEASSVASLGLAHAFLLAGARAVVASTRATYDREMPRFFTDLYREWDGSQDLAVALQRAQLDWRRRDAAADWASFRLFVP